MDHYIVHKIVKIPDSLIIGSIGRQKLVNMIFLWRYSPKLGLGLPP
jgi:hypothetical protein